MLMERDTLWGELNRNWDVIIIGGGITGAGIFREATRLGLQALLVEQRDFAWGSSSRSSKLVHGGLRYLRQGKVGLTRASVQEREQLLAEGPGLIEPLGFLLANYRGDRPGRFITGAGLSLYDLLALQWSHHYYSAADFRLLAGHLSPQSLKGGFSYGDAQTDDSRLVLRVIAEAVADGGRAINYAKAELLLRDPAGQVTGVRLVDQVQTRCLELSGRVIINATGVWADQLRQQLQREPHLRPLRGSHLIFPAWRFPVAQAISFCHPMDGRPVFALPWEGVTVIGTTDVDHKAHIDQEPAIGPEEVAYLMAATTSRFPDLALGLDDIVATFAGVRPVVSSGDKVDPSHESRDHVIWQEDGLLTVTGGKLTTFRLIAQDALQAIRQRLGELPTLSGDMPMLNPVSGNVPAGTTLDPTIWRRLTGRYGVWAEQLVGTARPGELQPIPGTSILWAELRWAARTENVVHLDDLLLRRVRFGLLLPHGGLTHIAAIRQICQPELGWDDSRWQAEVATYQQLISRCYGLPGRDTIPDWRAMLKEKGKEEGKGSGRSLPYLFLALSLLALSLFIYRHYRFFKANPSES